MGGPLMPRARFNAQERAVIAATAGQATPHVQWRDHATWKSARLRDTAIRTDPIGDEFVDAVNLTPSKRVAAPSAIRIYPGCIRAGRLYSDLTEGGTTVPKIYRVHVYDYHDQGRWLAQADFPRRRPTGEVITARFPVLNTPGRYEVRLNLVTPDGEVNANGWLQSGPDTAPPVTADLVAAVMHARAAWMNWPGVTVSAHPGGRFCIRLPAAAYEHAGGAHELAAWLGGQLGHRFGCDGVAWADGQGGKDAVSHLYARD
jgi:hypothetical protein